MPDPRTDDLAVLGHADDWERAVDVGLHGTPGVVARLVDDGVSPEVARAAVRSLAERGLLSYYASPAYAWLTEEGRTLLRCTRYA